MLKILEKACQKLCYDIFKYSIPLIQEILNQPFRSIKPSKVYFYCIPCKKYDIFYEYMIIIFNNNGQKFNCNVMHNSRILCKISKLL